MTTGDGQLHVVVTQQLGELGSGESEPAIVSWRWRYVLPSLGLWLTALLVLVVSYVVGKRQQDWPVVICIVLSFILFQMEGASILVATLIAALIVVWLIRRRQIPSAS